MQRPERAAFGLRPISRTRLAALAATIVLLHGCVTSRPAPVPTTGPQNGLASWYGQEFAGRTTANGEIFDPMQLTAAHRTLPFGSIVELTNPLNGKKVQVRINDRGPFIENRMIDLSYAAAEALGMIDEGVGPVQMAVVKVGAGDREPPAPYVVKIGDARTNAGRDASRDAQSASAPPVTPQADQPPAVAFPLPNGAPVAAPPAKTPTVERVIVEEQHANEPPMRKEVAPDGKTIINVPDPNAAPSDALGTRNPAPATPRASSETAGGRVSSPAPSHAAQNSTRRATGPQYFLQLGAFQQEANAKALQSKAASVTDVFIAHDADLYRVRVGPFSTRAKAIDVKEKLDAAGIASIVVTVE